MSNSDHPSRPSAAADEGPHPAILTRARLGADGHFQVVALDAEFGPMLETSRGQLLTNVEDALVRIPEAQREGLMASLRAAAQSLTPWDREWTVNSPERGERTMRGRAIPFREPDGATLFHCYIEDITRERQLRVALDESKEAFRIFFGESPVPLLLSIPFAGHVDANAALCELVGYSREQIVSRSLFELGVLPPEYLAQRHNELVTSGRLKPCLVSVRCADGSVLEVAVASTPLNLQNKRYILTSLVDVTDRVRTERAFHAQAVRLHRAVSAANVGLWEWNSRTGSVFLSAEWKAQLGYEPDGIADHFDEWVQRLHPEDKAHTLQTLQAYLDHPTGRYRVEFRLRHRDGTYRWICAEGAAELDGNGRPELMVGTHIDVTERKANEAELARQAATLRELVQALVNAEDRVRLHVSEVLHDHVQQLLVAAQIKLSAMAVVPPERREAMAESMRRLLADCLKATRELSTEFAPPTLREGRVDLALRALATSMADKYGLRVEVECTLHRPLEKVVARLLYDAASELLFNVVKHARVTQATLDLHEESPGELALTITDAGVGMAAKPQASAQQLGVATLRERLRLMGGQLEMEPGPLGGLRVCVRLSTAATGETLTGPQPRGGRDTGSDPNLTPLVEAIRARQTTILLVDDHKILRDGLRERLSREKDLAVIAEATDGREAIAMARRLQPSLVLMDITLPRVNGIEATRVICSELPKVRVIGLSMHSSSEIISALRAAGAVGYVNKDEPAETLIDLIRRVASTPVMSSPASLS